MLVTILVFAKSVRYLISFDGKV